MAVPPNITPATAAEITLPFSVTLNVTDAPQYDGDSCSEGFNSVWYVYTCEAGVNFLLVFGGVNVATSSTDNTPYTSVWTGTPSDLTLLKSSEDVEYCLQLQPLVPVDDRLYFRLPVSVGTTYYFQLSYDAAATNPAIILFTVAQGAHATCPAGSFVVSDDADGFPAAIFSPAGTFLNYVDFPAGEFTATLPNGLICTQDGTADLGVAILSRSLSRLYTITFDGELVAGIWSDQTAYFYVYTIPDGAPSPYHNTLYTIDPTNGSIVHTLAMTAGTGNVLKGGAASPDGTRFYAARGTVTIDAWNLTTDTIASTWTVTLGAGYQWQSTSRPGFTISDGSIFLPARNASNVTKTVKLSPADGSVAHTYAAIQGNVGFLSRLCYISDTQFGIWGFGAIGDDDPSYFQVINISDGSVASETTAINITDNSAYTQTYNTPNEISNSCPVFVLAQALEPTPPLPEGTVFPVRRVRRFALPYADNKYMFIRRLEFIFQPGTGYGQGQGENPVAMIRISGDGGRTWGHEIRLEAGGIGEYGQRMYVYNLGRHRDPWCELVVTDPNDWYFMGCMADVQEGTA